MNLTAGSIVSPARLSQGPGIGRVPGPIPGPGSAGSRAAEARGADATAPRSEARGAEQVSGGAGSEMLSEHAVPRRRLAKGRSSACGNGAATCAEPWIGSGAVQAPWWPDGPECGR